MAGDWIKVEHVTPDKPEVVTMANLLDIDQDSVTGKLLRLWVWADQNSLDGCALSVTKVFIDRITFCDGFATALERVGWLDSKDGILILPNFDRHNGQTAKKRSSSNRRMAKSREKKKLGCGSVTHEAQQKAQPEKRREEKSSINTNTKKSFMPPTLEEFIEYLLVELPKINPGWMPEQIARACNVQFDTYTDQKWHTGGDKPRKISNWKTTAKNSMKHLKPWNFGSSTQPSSNQQHKITEYLGE